MTEKGRNMKYDYLIVGAGLFGAVFAHEAYKKGKKCLVIDKREHLAGNIYTEKIDDIDVHKYGAHIFHTSDKKIWQYVNQFAEFNNYINSPVAIYGDELYNLPFNMNTFSKMWGIKTPAEAKAVMMFLLQMRYMKLQSCSIRIKALTLYIVMKISCQKMENIDISRILNLTGHLIL